MTIVCNVCELGKSKYKCPECLISYCSLDCWKTHKSSSTCKPVVYKQLQRRITLVHSATDNNSESTSEDAVALEKLEALADSEDLKEVLKNHELREMLIAIDKSNHPAQAIQAAMVEPMFVEFADICLKIVEPPSE